MYNNFLPHKIGTLVPCLKFYKKKIMKYLRDTKFTDIHVCFILSKQNEDQQNYC